MTLLALARLPDRNPVKRTISCAAELNKALEDYALLYHETYGQTEPVESLIPFMLAAFLAKDRAFTAYRKKTAALGDEAHKGAADAHRRKRRGSPPIPGSGTPA